MGLDLVAQGEVGAGIGASGLVELFAEGGYRLSAPRGGERVEPDERLAGAGVDVDRMSKLHLRRSRAGTARARRAGLAKAEPGAGSAGPGAHSGVA